jgi:hypothetical protein
MPSPIITHVTMFLPACLIWKLPLCSSAFQDHLRRCFRRRESKDTSGPWRACYKTTGRRFKGHERYKSHQTIELTCNWTVFYLSQKKKRQRLQKWKNKYMSMPPWESELFKRRHNAHGLIVSHRIIQTRNMYRYKANSFISSYSCQQQGKHSTVQA